MKYVIALVTALLLNAAANVLIKIGMKKVAITGGLLREGVLPAAQTVLGNAALIIGLACFALNAAFYMYALQSHALKISIAYPIMVGGGYAIIALIAHFHPALSESLTMGQKLGVGLVLCGILMIAWFGETSGVPSPTPL